MNTIEEACDAIKNHLNTWYQFSKQLGKCYGMTGGDLYDAKQDFIKQNPEYQKYDFDIETGFIVDRSTWRPISGRMTARGTYAVPIDWEQTRNLALKESKTLTLIKSISR